MFHTRLKGLREAAGYSQYTFADAIGVAQSTVGNWESGKREPNFETTQKIANFFDVSVDYLLGRALIKNGSAEAEPKKQPDMEDLRFALSGEVKDLTDEEFAEIMNYVRFVEQKRKSEKQR